MKSDRKAEKQIRKFVQERNAVLRSLNKDRILLFAKKNGVALPSDERTFWAAIHKARLEVTTFTDEEKQVSRNWLVKNGLLPSRVSGDEMLGRI